MLDKRFFKLFKRGMAVALAMSLVTGLAPVNTAPVKNVKEAKAAGSDIVVGNTYSFGGYDWIAAEASGNMVVLQSKGVTAGPWPGYTIWGNNSSYGSDIAGRDISSYNTKTQNLYNDIKYAEYGSSGLYLVSNSKAGQTSAGNQGSGYYWQALKAAAGNYSSFGASNNAAWLGTVGSRSFAWCVNSDGYVSYYDNQYYSYVVAPAFILDKSKVTVSGNTIIIKKTHSITYDVTTNGGTSSTPSSIEVDADTVLSSSSSALSETASKPGWEFVGWNTDRNANTGLTSLTMDSDKKLYAIFKKNINTSFTDFNGTEKRTQSKSSTLWNSDTSASVTLPGQGTKTGWTSAGWSLSKEPDPSKIISTPSYNISDSTDFYGIYKKTVSVNIDTDGDGQNDSTKDTDIYANSGNPDITQGTITAPSTSPSKEGYEFDGWTEKGGNGTVYPPGTEMTVTGSGDIVPHFTPVKYKVHFDINNGTSGTMEDMTLTYDEAADLTANTFGRPGYTFTGWSDSPSGDVRYTDGQSVKNLSKVKDDTVNLYAVWKINSSGLTVAPAGGTWKHDGTSHTSPETFRQDYNTALNIEIPERTGYTFTEWIKTYDETKASGFNGKLDGNVYTFGEKDSAADTLTASWTANTYKAEYYDGAAKKGEDTFTYDTSAPLKTAESLGIIKTGYDFKGWSDSPSGDVKYTDGQIVKNLTSVKDGIVKLYAVRPPHKYTITYNGVTGAANNNKSEYTVEDTDFKLSEPVKEGCVFLGWTGEGFTAPSKDISVKTSEHKDLEYTAVWQTLISVSVPAQVQVKMSGGTPENRASVAFVNSSKSDVKVNVSSFAQTAAGDYRLVDKAADEKAEWKKLSHKDRTMALYVENTKDSGFKTSGTKVYVNDADTELGVISPGVKASPYITCHHTPSITDEETSLSMGSYTIQWTVSLIQ